MKKINKHYFFYFFAFIIAVLSFGNYWGAAPSNDYDFELKFYIVNEIVPSAKIDFIKRSAITRQRVDTLSKNVPKRDSIQYLLQMNNLEEIEQVSYNGIALATEEINSSNVYRIHYYPPEKDEIIETLIRNLKANKKVDPGIIATKIVAYEMEDADSPKPFDW